MAQQRARGAAELHHRSEGAGEECRRRSSSRSARRRAAATATPICPMCTTRRARSRRRSTAITVVVTKSTVPVGTGDEVERIIREARPDAQFAVVSNPEFLREGAAIRDFKHPDRIVVGTEDERAKQVMNEFYRPLYLNSSPIMITDRRTRRADQIRRQRVSCDQDHLHQRDRGLVREGRRRRAAHRARHRASTTASARNSCMPAPVTAARAFPRTRWR